jgi:hypothetical protein
MKRSYTRTTLSHEARQLLEKAIHNLGTKQAVADKMKVSRTAISLALSDKYEADVKILTQKIYASFNTPFECPHLREAISEEQCIKFRERPFASPNREYVMHVMACRNCSHNPQALLKGEAA